MTGHLEDLVSAYADRRLPPSALLFWDRHLVACGRCRAAVEQERRLLDSLRTGPLPGLGADFHAMLVGLAASDPVAATPPCGMPSAPDAPVGPQVPRAASPVVGLPSAATRLRTLSPKAPAQHRSIRRAVALAGVAATASAAAMWAVGSGAQVRVAPVDPSGSFVVTPVVVVTSTVSATPSPPMAPIDRSGSLTTVSQVATGWTALPIWAPASAPSHTTSTPGATPTPALRSP